MKTWQVILSAIFFIIIAAGLFLFSQVRGIEVERVTEDLHVLYGMGGNVAVLDTDKGAVIVDTMTFALQGQRIRDIAEELTGKPVSMVINTHYHLDHTHGNPAFDPGTRVVATERTLHHLRITDGETFSGAAEALLPNETFTDELTLNMGNKTILLKHLGRGHTDGDLVALFVEDNVIHTGDLFFNQHYPNIDLEAGGTVQEWGDTLDNVIALKIEKVIPGHGPVADVAALKQFQAFIRQLAAAGRVAAEKDLDLETMLSNAELTEDEGYEPIKMIVDIGLDRNFVLKRAWEESTGNYERRD